MKGNPSGKMKNPPSYGRGTYGARGASISFGADQNSNKSGQASLQPVNMPTKDFSRTSETHTPVSGKTVTIKERGEQSMNMTLKDFSRTEQKNGGGNG